MNKEIQDSENVHPRKVLKEGNLKNQNERLSSKEASPMTMIDLNKKREVSIIGTPTKERSYQENLLQKGTPKDYQEHKEGKIEKRRTDISESCKDDLMAFTKNFQMLEQKSTVDPMYLIKAKNCITPERRKTLFLWISAVSFKGFEPPVEVPIFETTRLLDLFLSRNIQAKLSYRDFQIIALSCLVISAEIMDCRYFSFRQRLPDIIETMKEVYSFDAITHWVQHIRKSLLIDPKKTFGRLQVNSHLFFSFFSKALGIEKEPFMFGNMLLELSLMDHHFLRFRQSLIGFSCACLVLNFFLGGDVTKLVQKYQEFFCEEEVRSCGRELAQLTLKENMISLIEEKYQSKGNLNVSRFSFHPSETQYKKRSSSLE